VPDASAGGKSAAPETIGEITDKRGFGARWLFSPRHVDNLLKMGLPHCKIGKRRVRILIPEADAWMKARFGTQRRVSPKGSSSDAADKAA